MKRRDFLKNVGAGALLAATPDWTRAAEKISPDVKWQNEKKAITSRIGQTTIPQSFAMKKALPVWLAGLEYEKNIFAGFRTVVGKANTPVKIYIATSGLYRLSINGEFVCHGPARVAHSFYRVDEIDITKYLNSEKNIVAIEAAGYNVTSFYVLYQPSFLQAEILSGEKVIAATSADTNADFQVMWLEYKVQKAERYDWPRCFTEVYALVPGFDKWKTDVSYTMPHDNLQLCLAKSLITRRVPLPVFPVLKPSKIQSTGVMTRQKDGKEIKKARYLRNVRSTEQGFKEQELACIPSIELQYYNSTAAKHNDIRLENAPFKIDANEYIIFEFSKSTAGFICSTINCLRKSKVYFVFDEKLTNNDIDFLRIKSINIVTLELEPGTYTFESFEPYSVKYLKAFVAEGACTLDSVAMREFKSPMPINTNFKCQDKSQKTIYDACIETYRQNSIDAFIDCPSRERASWLGDSFFTAKAAYLLAGNTDVETNFLENFVIAKEYPQIPDGALPMCYPADHYSKQIIPNWPLWMILELQEYIVRGGSMELVEKFRPRLFRYVEFLDKYANSDGLLEDLPGWVFVEFSKANGFVKNVNYPTNMLYAAALRSLGTIYSDDTLIKRADKLKSVILKQSFNGKYFIDNAVRENGILRTTSNSTEACQYYAFFCDIACPRTHSQLWNEIVNNFGPDKTVSGIHPATVFLGYCIRWDLLLRYEKTSQLSKEVTKHFIGMAENIGTVGDIGTPESPCCFGFASYAAYLLNKAGKCR